MTDETVRDRDAFARIVKEGLHKAEQYTVSLRSRNNWLLMASIISSGATTLVAGGTAVRGSLIEIGEANWRLACIVAAALAFIATICTTLNQQLKLGDRLAQGQQCVSRLRLLDVNITVGGHSWEEISKEYSEIAKSYPEPLG